MPVENMTISLTDPFKLRVLPGSSGSILLGESDIPGHGESGMFSAKGPPEPWGRAYSRGLGESVTRGDRRERELEFGSSFPPLASPRE